jgi:hypothetical protein
MTVTKPFRSRVKLLARGLFQWQRCALICVLAATSSHAGEVWRQGWIREIVVGSQLDDVGDRPCVAKLPAQEIAEGRFAEVTFPRGRGRGYRTLLLPDGLDLKRGEKVWIPVSGCKPPSRTLPEQAEAR